MERLDTEEWVFDLDGPMSHDHAHASTFAMDEPARAFPPSQDAEISGTSLRHRLIKPEAIVAIHAEEPRQSLVQRLLRRK